MTNESRNSFLSSGGAGVFAINRPTLARSMLMSIMTNRIGTKTTHTILGSKTRFSIFFHGLLGVLLFSLTLSS